MSRYWPHSAYAEDQPFARTILWTHVLYRGLQTGAAIGLPIGAVQHWRQSRDAVAPSITRPAMGSIVLRSTGRAAIVTTALMVPGLLFRMHGREEIEWQDRSWRLIENKGQVETDDWSLVGTAAGIVAVGSRAAAQQTLGARVVALAGGAGAGSLVGVIGYMVWRYGVKGGKRDGE